MKSHSTRILFCVLLSLFGLWACTDDDSFTDSTANRLTFSMDTVSLDTVFSTVPSPVKSFWVYNHSGDGLRCSSVRLEGGNQVGFRVNVDGVYLSPTAGYQTDDIEVRKGDSIRVFVELTSPLAYADGPKQIEDNLLFTLESGVQQRVNLSAFAWDADLLRNVTIEKDTTISSPTRPVVVYGGMSVAEGATLTIDAGTTLYFHSDAGLDVHGTLVCRGTAESNVVLRGDRLDHMFDYLPYDFVSGQWQGVHIRETSYGNTLAHTDIHGAFDGMVVDSSDVARQTLDLESSTIHNCQGEALSITNSRATIANCQLTNALGNCLNVDGGDVSINNSTLAQFYPFDSNRGNALRFDATTHPLVALSCQNSLITGYADDVLSGIHADDEGQNATFAFDHCVIRTPRVETQDSIYFSSVTFEDANDTTQVGKRHFAKIDEENLRYDFRLDSLSWAIGRADPATATLRDHDDRLRDDAPDAGAYEYTRPEATEPANKQPRWKNCR